jgi:aspartate/methionine/tyrosine aminotransferase
MLCNPHNPTGRTRKLVSIFLQWSGVESVEFLLTLLSSLDSRETLLSYCFFAEKHDLHLVVDEVYGMSVFSVGGTLDWFVMVPERSPTVKVSDRPT